MYTNTYMCWCKEKNNTKLYYLNLKSLTIKKQVKFKRILIINSSLELNELG